MITLLDTIGPAIWRASWQAAALALLVVLLLRCFGERLSPRWRFLLWGVVLTRLLFVATPVSPWSVFNLVRWNPEASARPIAQREADATFTPVPHRSDATTGPNETNVESPRVADSAPESVQCAGECARGDAIDFLRDRDGIDAVHQRSVRRRLHHADPVVVLAGRLSVAGVEAPGDRARLASAAFGLPPRDGCRHPGTSGNIPPPDRTQTDSRLARHARVPQSLHRGDLESQNCPAGIGRDGIFDRAAPPCAGARTGASGARRSVDELAAADGADSALVQSRGLVDGPRDAGRARGRLRRIGVRRAGRDRSIRVCRHDRRTGGEPGPVRHRAGADRPVLFDVPPEGARRTSLAVPFGHDAPDADCRRLVARDGLAGPDRRHAGRQGTSAEGSRVDRERGAPGKHPHRQRTLRQ